MLSFEDDFLFSGQVCAIVDGDLKVVGFITDDGTISLNHGSYSISDLSAVIAKSKLLKHD